MMACSYLSAGGMKSESSGAACWSPPAMTGLAPDTRLPLPTPSMTLPSGPTALPNSQLGIQTGLANLPSAIGLPRAPMVLPRAAMPKRAGPMGQESPVGLPRPIGLPCASMGPVGIPTGQMGLPSGSTGLPSGLNAQLGLPPPFTRKLPMEFGGLPQSGPSSEPALDLSTSASPMTSSQKSRLPSPEDPE